ncbi:hypothetical protein [Maricaulis sp.]|uniref:hypothetical protein n=1 Tax=Maricaulis sp. TaxID=1486257 RepID=UPI003A946372
MANMHRNPDARAALQARARSLREQGLTLAQVSDEIDVSETTLNRWARQGGWRLADIAGTAPNESAPDQSGSGERAPDADIPDDIPAVPAEEAASVLVARATRYALAGQMARSAVAAKLAQQLIELSLRQAEVAALKVQTDLKSGRRLPPELVGVPLDETCRPLEYPEGWDLARAERAGRMDLVPVERLRDDLYERLVLNPPAWLRGGEPEVGGEAGHDATADPEAREAAGEPPATITDNDRVTDSKAGSAMPEAPAETGPRIRFL